jgi:hypothetical protein
MLAVDEWSKDGGSFDCLFDIIKDRVMTTWCIFVLFEYSTSIPNHPPADALYRSEGSHFCLSCDLLYP